MADSEPRAEGLPADGDVQGPERTVVDLLSALEQSVLAAREARKRHPRPALCMWDSPQGWLCTRPEGHEGDHE